MIIHPGIFPLRKMGRNILTASRRASPLREPGLDTVEEGQRAVDYAHIFYPVWITIWKTGLGKG